MHLQIKLSTGVILRAKLLAPSSTEGANKLAVCLHPYGHLGGRMSDPVLQAVTNPLLEHGYHVLRYNSRGFGGSSGWPSLSGMSEGKDLEALVDWATQQIQDIQSIVVVGYSYGSLITTLFPILPSIKTSHVLISYPLSPRGLLTLFNSNTYSKKLRDLIQNPEGNVFVIFGNSDEFTSASKYEAWADTLRSEIQNGAKLELVTVPDATHFWHGRAEDKLVSHLRNWLQK